MVKLCSLRCSPSGDIERRALSHGVEVAAPGSKRKGACDPQSALAQPPGIPDLN